MPSTRSKQKQPRKESVWKFDAIGTGWSVETGYELSSEIKRRINETIDEFDKSYSRFRDDSIVSRIASRAGSYTFGPECSDLIALYRRLYDATNGAVTPLVGDTLSSLGYDARYSLRSHGAKPVPQWGDVMTWDGGEVTTIRPVILDFGAVGKGYLVDLVAGILEQEGVDRYVIDASGDIRHRGDEALRVGLESPSDPTRVIGVVDLDNRSLCASATNRRRWGDTLHHVIDGNTGNPTQDIVATWAVADTTATADALATALFFADQQALSAFEPFEYVRIFADGRVEGSASFVGELFV